MLDAIVPDDGATWNTLGCSQEMADLLKAERHSEEQSLPASREEISIGRALSGDLHFLRNVMTAGGEERRLRRCPDIRTRIL